MSRKSQKKPTYYVAIGASAGGLEAIETFFQNMPVDTGLAFVVLQHLSPDYRSMMPELLAKQTKMQVNRAEEGMLVEPNNIYLITPKNNISIVDGKLNLTEQDRHRGLVNLPIDIFLESLAKDQGELGVAIILSGTGSDGTRGIKAIKASGGMVMVQAPQSAKFDGMPKSAQETGLADYILPPQEMPAQLIKFIKHPYAPSVKQPSNEILTLEEGMTSILEKLHDKHRVNFKHYKPNTLVRRIRRRISINQLDDLNRYLEFVEANPEELNSLFQELLIGVTSFFRDHHCWELLQTQIMPQIIQAKQDKVLRLWSVGSSTGEEAYSLAILANECCKSMGKKMEIKVFATDIDGEAIVTGGKGVYPASTLADMPQELRLKYFSQQENTYTVNRDLREMVVFARQNILSDPPFTNIDLISCRNLLIYFEPIFQKKALSVFSFSLREGGILFLGKSESPGNFEQDYEVIDSGLKLYRLKKRRLILNNDSTLLDAKMGLLPTVQKRELASSNNYSENIMERLLRGLTTRFLPTVAVVNEANHMLYLSGNTHGLFGLAEGSPTMDVMRLAHPDLSLPLSTGLHKCFRENEQILYTNIRIKLFDKVLPVNLHIMPLPLLRSKEEKLLAVLIEPLDQTKISKESIKGTFDLENAAEQRIQDLENELQLTRENLQATVEELETSNEELQATNEELLSSSEELQSTNEELQSVNEELHTVNAEMVSKNEELSKLGLDLQVLLVSSDSALLLLDEELNVRQFTKSLVNIFHLQEADIGRPVAYITHELNVPNIMAVFEKVSASGHGFVEDVTDSLGNNYILRILPSEKGAKGRYGLALSLVNITERVQSEKVLRESEERFRLMVNSLSGVVIHLVDPKGYITTWNEAAQTFTGFDRKEVLAKKFDFFYQSNKGNDICADMIKRALESGKAEHTGWRIKQDGSTYWATDVIRPLRDEAQNLLGYVRISEDKSDQRERAEQLHKFSQAIEQSHEQILLTDINGVIEFVNKSYLEMSGKGIEEIIGKKLDQKLSSMISDAETKSLRESLASGALWQGELQRKTNTEEPNIFQANLTPLYKENKKLNGFLMRLIDITETIRFAKAEKKHAEELEKRVEERTLEFEKAKLEAERLAKVKSEFIANMSHEIRTPMNAMLGLAYVLKKMDLPEKATELARKIHHSGETLMGVLNDVLDFSKIEAGKIEIAHEPFNLIEIVDNLANIMQASAAGKGLELSISPPSREACHLIGDSLRLSQILMNLTSNAIKFTKKGFVELKIQLLNKEDKKATFNFIVRDSGIGMDDAAMKRLFNAFEQADSSTTRRFGGTGLGLSISQRFVELMGGHIIAKSVPEQGSEFSFTLTFETENKTLSTMETLRGLNFLVADDNDISLYGMGETLKSLGWKPELFGTGKEIFQRVLADMSLQSSKTIMIVDWFMPDMGGGELISQLRQQLPPDKQPTMIVVTAHDLEEIKSSPESALIDCLLPKPMGPSDIYNAVLAAVHPESIKLSGIKSRSLKERALEGLRLLVVDDNELNLDVANHIFTSQGATVYSVGDGKQAIAWLDEHPDTVDLVLMDVHMPVMDGLEASRIIRQKNAFKTLPILALTAGVLKDQLAKIHAAGMNGFIPKPFVVTEAVDEILEHTKFKNLHVGIKNHEVLPQAGLSYTQLLNIAGGECVLGNSESYERFLKRFSEMHQSVPNKIYELRHDETEIKSIAHKLRGTAGNLRLDQLAEIAGLVEDKLIEGDPVESETQQLIDILEQTLIAIEHYLSGKVLQ